MQSSLVSAGHRAAISPDIQGLVVGEQELQERREEEDERRIGRGEVKEKVERRCKSECGSAASRRGRKKFSREPKEGEWHNVTYD